MLKSVTLKISNFGHFLDQKSCIRLIHRSTYTRVYTVNNDAVNQKMLGNIAVGDKNSRLTPCANLLFVDGADFNGLRDTLQVDGVVAAEVAAVLQLGVAPAVEGTCVVAKSLQFYQNLLKSKVRHFVL